MKDNIDLEEKKFYTFGIQDKTGKWHYLIDKYKLHPIHLREAYYADKKIIEQSAEFIMEHLDSNMFIFDSACIFELTIDAIPFNFKRNIK